MDSVLIQVKAQLEVERGRYQAEYDKRSAVAENARRACVPVQQRLEHIKDALDKIRRALEWTQEGDVS